MTGSVVVEHAGSSSAAYAAFIGSAIVASVTTASSAPSIARHMYVTPLAVWCFPVPPMALLLLL
ncbi:hypothetical protein [Bifidobacterium primatium]|uniref:hypothetical protein n=1 Tax=Bifidobacterium primatium TaxID=2045438 RepID=UPI0010568CCC|nr:hypothetical protein [Bifidobacterium primatium]